MFSKEINFSSVRILLGKEFFKVQTQIIQRIDFPLTKSIEKKKHFLKTLLSNIFIRKKRSFSFQRNEIKIENDIS